MIRTANRFSSLMMLVALGGCAHKTPPPSPPPPTPAVVERPYGPTPTGRLNTCGADTDCGEKQLCVNGRCIDITASLAECTKARVHFPFNSDQIDQNDVPMLQRSARCLKAERSLHIVIEGNADERGTQEYNMALGDRRARAVAGYLKSLGVSDMQLRTISYGKENPECSEHDEACWARNRRAGLKAGGTN